MEKSAINVKSVEMDTYVKYALIRHMTIHSGQKNMRSLGKDLLITVPGTYIGVLTEEKTPINMSSVGKNFCRKVA